MNLSSIVYASVLALSVLVLIFWIFYTIILVKQVKHSTARKDWKISMVFYFGIVLLVLADIIFAISQLYNYGFGNELFNAVEVISLVIFIVGFYLRMESSTKTQPPV